ncbi:hypothetical protein, partial [Staphylococcus epidermidis]|uniref:hypothetical protein n=1 Tax=Staphylococcus epidermidis TaxID=1282 RepID=UPI0011A77C4D
QLPMLNIPTHYPTPTIKTTNPNILTFHYNPQVKQQFKSYVQQHQVTDFIFFPTPIIVLFHKYTPHHDIPIRTVITART